MNLNIITIGLKSIVRRELIGLDESFKGIYFGHVFSKAFQYVIIDEKVCINFIFVSIKFAQYEKSSPNLLGRANKNGTRFVQLLNFTQEN
jgi:hypothetical protein